MLKSIGAILAGFIAWTVLWLGSNAAVQAIHPDAYAADGTTTLPRLLILLLVLAAVISVASGYVTGRIAERQATRHGLWLGLLLLAVGIFVQLQYWDLMPLWYHLIFLALLLPAAFYGAARYDNGRTHEAS